MPSAYYEFFAGGGMVRAGLGPRWRCLLANDFDAKKVRAYKDNWGAGEVVEADVAALAVADLPGRADLAWASFPCQDLSLAGNGAGLRGSRSGSFWGFWRLMEGLAEEQREPRLIVLENVCGLLSSRTGRDFRILCGAFRALDYRVGAMVINADRFVPQSRARLFVIGVRQGAAIPSALLTDVPAEPWHTPALRKAHSALDGATRRNWFWWSMPAPGARQLDLADVLEDEPTGVEWFSPERTQRLLDLMSPAHRERVEDAKSSGERRVGGVYRRIRPTPGGGKTQRAEVRFDSTAGCLRTPAGGSSRQTVLIVDGENVRARLISPREAARLMGLPDDYRLPSNYNDAYHLAGDGVAVPVVRHLERHILTPCAKVDLSKDRSPCSAEPPAGHSSDEGHSRRSGKPRRAPSNR